MLTLGKVVSAPNWSSTHWTWRSGDADPNPGHGWCIIPITALNSIQVVGVHPPCPPIRARPFHGIVGDCFDNAVVESFWARMQVELLNRQRWRTRIELANAIFEYVEIFHNRQRRHSSLEMRTPIEYERIHHNNPTPMLQTQAS